MYNLPQEILLSILEYLSVKDLSNLTAVSSLYHSRFSGFLYKYPKIRTKKQLEAFIDIPPELQALVTTLNLSKVCNHVPEDLFVNKLQNLNNLKLIDLSGCHTIEASSVTSVIRNNVLTLQAIVIVGCDFSEETLKYIGDALCENLITLDMKNTYFRPAISVDDACDLGAMFTKITSPVKLRTLCLAWSRWVAPCTIQNVVSCLPHLQKLDLNWCDNLSFSICIGIVPRMKFLSVLDIGNVELRSLIDHEIALLEAVRFAVSLKKVSFSRGMELYIK